MMVTGANPLRRIRLCFNLQRACRVTNCLTDEEVAAALKETSPEYLLVQTVNHVASCAYFDRVIEAVGLPVE
ncbi:MAG: hypothetical protein U0936_12995 [Planctomycetaceae bacterium]